jgi:hypothetical protein
VMSRLSAGTRRMYLVIGSVTVSLPIICNFPATAAAASPLSRCAQHRDLPDSVAVEQRDPRQRARFPKMRQMCGAAALVIAISLGLSGVALGTPGYDWPGMSKCGSFKASYRIYVYANDHLRCAKARRIMKEYWLGPESRKVIVNGGTGASGYVKLKRYKGWRCFSGAGGGTCRHGRAVAGYQN